MPRRTILPVTLALAATACGGDATGPDSSRFEAVVTGAMHSTLVGLAEAGSSADGGTFLIEMHSETDEPFVVIILSRPGGARPAPGQYSVAPRPSTDGFAVAFLQRDGGSVTGDLEGTSGRIRIEASDSSRVRGEFDFTAVGFLSTGAGTLPDAEIQVTGTFSAPVGR